MNTLTPTVGQWYSIRHDGFQFEVIDVDLEGGVIELQDVYGAIAEIGADSWLSMDLEATTEPADPDFVLDEWDTDEVDITHLPIPARDSGKTDFRYWA